jgi:hypothetical protein
VQRILVPLLVGGVILLPLCFYVFAFGWWAAGECTWNEIRRVKFAPAIQAELWGPVHLWFLQYLLLYAVLFWVWQRLQWRAAATRALARAMTRCVASSWRPLWCALPTALVIAANPEVVITHHNRFVPEPFEFLHYGIYFAWGVALYRVDATMTRFVGAGWSCLAVSFALIVAAQVLLRQFFAGTLSATGNITLALAFALFAWFSIFGFFGVFQSLFARQRTALQYVADAAYWIYLIHLPLVAALQIALAPLPAPVVLKCALVIGLATGVCLWSYERWVRYGRIGAVLNGRRVRRPPPPVGDLRHTFTREGEPPGEPPVPAFR